MGKVTGEGDFNTDMLGLYNIDKLTAIAPVGLKIGARNDRYYTTWSKNRCPE